MAVADGCKGCEQEVSETVEEVECIFVNSILVPAASRAKCWMGWGWQCLPNCSHSAGTAKQSLFLSFVMHHL